MFTPVFFQSPELSDLNQQVEIREQALEAKRAELGISNAPFFIYKQHARMHQLPLILEIIGMNQELRFIQQNARCKIYNAMLNHAFDDNKYDFYNRQTQVEDKTGFRNKLNEKVRELDNALERIDANLGEYDQEIIDQEVICAISKQTMGSGVYNTYPTSDEIIQYVMQFAVALEANQPRPQRCTYIEREDLSFENFLNLEIPRP